MRVAAILFLIGIGYLTFSGLFENSIYYVGVAEALELTPKDLTAARVFGTVQEQGIQTESTGKGIRFQLADSDNPGKTLTVVYGGTIPDTFKAGAEVFVEGRLDHTHNQFDAKMLVTKCPSKYQKENRS